ncbi:MAG: DUF5615 family PIN-like protein [Halobacteriales archaeon]|nr:DUF5615 family PIN-like protein [Halobacteriales archaeon]
MSYRVLCDENTEPQLVRYLEKQGHDASYVPDVLGKGTTDDEVARYAEENGSVILTNDKDFLNDESFPDVKVLYYSCSGASAYEIAGKVNEATSYFPDQGSLPRTVWLD